MKRLILTILIIGFILISSVININALKVQIEKSDGLKISITSTGRSFEGYTLFSPEYSKDTFLINNTGTILHQWKSNYIQGLGLYLLENGNLLRTGYINKYNIIIGGGDTGCVEMMDWDGSRLWFFKYADEQNCLHHDIEPLPNGNILMIAWEHKSYEETLEAGGNPSLIPKDGIWADHIIEVKPIIPEGGEIVWEWHVWDHLIQNFDPTKNNYGIIADNPGLVNINYGDYYPDWNHINSIDYNEKFNQILLSVRNLNEIWIIDHSTNTVEAASHSGGRYKKGGDILYRWGNPQVYHAGDTEDQKFFNQHSASWVESGCPGEGHITVFNNGWERPEDIYSSVEEIVPPVDNNGNYFLEPNSAFGPKEAIWSYTAENQTDFFSRLGSSARRLPNGNTLICSTNSGHIFEVTDEKEIVWEYTNSYPIDVNMVKSVFSAYRYPIDYSGIHEFNNKIVSQPIETEHKPLLFERLISLPIFFRLFNFE